MSGAAERKLQNCRDRIVTIEDEFSDVMMGQYIFLEVQKIIEGNEMLSSIGSDFFVYLRRSFVDSLVLAVRRQVDTKKNVESLHRLLVTIRESQVDTDARLLHAFLEIEPHGWPGGF